MWAIVYNLLWLVAWFVHMGTEWRSVYDALGKPLPWTPSVLAFWALLTIPFGVAIALYAADKPNARRAAIHAAIALWIPLTIGGAAWMTSASLPLRLVVLDAIVNLAAVLVAASGCSGRRSVLRSRA